MPIQPHDPRTLGGIIGQTLILYLVLVGGLALLLRRISRPLAALTAYMADPGPDARGTTNLRASYPELESLEYFRSVWSRVSADRQVRQSQEQVHKNAGPLNSNQLVHRALSLMREVSPGYLQQFLSYTDALMWLEQVHAALAPPPREAAPRAGAKKTARGKGR